MEGFGLTLPIEVVNTGTRPFVVLALEARGLGRGTRRLFVPAGDRLRAFGFVPPGETGRWRLGLHFPRPGTGTLWLRLRVRPLPAGIRGPAMVERRIPREGDEVVVRRRIPVAVEPRRFGREAALARFSGPVDEAFYSGFLEAWVVRQGNAVSLARVSETVSAPGLDLRAAAALDEFGMAVPIVGASGRPEILPRAAARRRIERALGLGWRVQLVTYSGGRRAIRVAP